MTTLSQMTNALSLTNVADPGRIASEVLASEARHGGRSYRVRIASMQEARDLGRHPGYTMRDLDRWVGQDARLMAEGSLAIRYVTYPVYEDAEGQIRPARVDHWTNQRPDHKPAMLPEGAFDWAIYREALTPRPQVYAQNSSENGGLDVVVTRGEVDLIQIDWDNYDENANGLDNYELVDLQTTRADLERIADPRLREQLLKSMDEVIQSWHAQDQMA